MNGFCARESLGKLRSARRLGTDGSTVMARLARAATPPAG